MASRPGVVVLWSLCALAMAATARAASSAEERSVAELRNTVIGLLQALVERGVLTKDQAQAMIRDAQAKAEREASAKAVEERRQEQEEAGAIRVPYVPQIVKDEIRKEVLAELGPSLTHDVVEQARTKENLRAALPEWVQRVRWTGDVRVRGEGDAFARDNALNSYLDFQAINARGGIAKAGTDALLNTSFDRDRLRLRLRFGFDAELGAGWAAGMRLASGAGETYVTTNQTLGTYADRYRIAVDQAYVRWLGTSATGRQVFTASGGRFANPWVSTDLVWYNDLTFEGIVSSYRLNLSSDNDHRHDLFVTLGAFPLQDVTPSSHDKWLTGGQIGADLHTQHESRLRLGAAYYDYLHIVGQRNSPESNLLNYTAPGLLQKGNTLYDISNTADPTVNLFALAADYRLVDVIAIGDLRAFSRYSFGLTAEAVKNIGFKTAAVLARTGTFVAPRTKGYRADLSFGSRALGEAGTWRFSAGYRYLERDAVLDAFNDQDFHLGGTDTKGYTLTLDYAVNPHVWARARYLSANEIDGPPLGVDVWQLDLNTQF